MKGIRKVFLGLVFLTLFGVGFKENVKAYEAHGGLVKIQSGRYVDVEDVNEAEGIAAYVDFYPGDFSTTETAYNISGSIWETVSAIPVKTKLDGTQAKISLDDGSTYTNVTTSETAPYQVVLKYKSLRDLWNILKDDEKGQRYVYSISVNSNSNSFYVHFYKISLTSSYEGDPDKGPTVTFVDEDNPDSIYNGAMYLFGGETGRIHVTTSSVPTGMIPGYWLDTNKSSTGTATNQTYTINTNNIGKTTTLYADYVVNPSATLDFSPGFSGTYLAPNKSSNPNRKFTFGSGTYTGNNVSSLKFKANGTMPEIPVPESAWDFASGSSGIFTFTVPASVVPGTQTLLIEMDDGMIYEIEMNIVNPAISITPATSNISIGDKGSLTATVTPALSGTITYEFFGITPTTYDQYIKATTSGNNFNFEGIKETTTGVKVRARAKVPVEGMENTWIETDAATGSATINVTSPTFNTLGTVYANEGLNVNLAKFINNGSGGGVNVTAVSSSGGYISNETTLPALAKNVNLKGKKTGTNTNDVSVTASGTTKTANVVVYPKPSLSVSDSGSGSSLKYTFKLTVPKAVYDGTTVISDVDKAVLEFKGKKDTYVYDESISLESDGDLKKKNKDTISIDIKKLTEIFDKVCEDDSEEVKVTTYVKGDKNCISDEHKIHVYKIKLDGSAGADYKINGESKSDKFYAIKDKSYEISTTPKSGYNGTPTKWDGTSFGTSSSGSTSFSESKTVKAYYTGGSSSSSSSSRQTANNSAATGDDYDDVPKTGESKADIWILWSVLFISILGAGFMIWKRFGLVRAIAEAEEEVAIAEREERIETEAKEKQEKIDMLKNLRNL